MTTTHTQINHITPQDLQQIITEAVRKAVNEITPAKPTHTEEEFLTRYEAAELAKVSTSTIDGRRRDGSLVPHRSGRTVRYKRSDILKLFQPAQA